MSRRLEIELTSDRADGKWTWRAAGAKEPKGLVDAELLPQGSSVGDTIRVEAEASLDGLEITAVLPTRAPKSRGETLQLLGASKTQPLVTSQVANKVRSRARGSANKIRKDGKRRSDTKQETQPKDKRKHKKSGHQTERAERQTATSQHKRKKDKHRATNERPRPNSAPRAPRLRPKNKNSRAALKELPEISQELAAEVLRGGVGGLRKSIQRMNTLAKADGIPQVKSEPLIALAEKLAPILKAAEWRDRAEEAYAKIDTVDLRDIRTVIVAADSAARDETSRELASKIQAGLTERVEREHRVWLNEIAQDLTEGRTVRALARSSRPPKAGSPLPPDMAERLSEAASNSLTSDTSQQRWSMLIDAVAYSPVRTAVRPQSCPEKPNEQLLATLRKLAAKIPQIASQFGIAAKPTKPRKNAESTQAKPPPPPPPAPPPPPPPVPQSS
ncbi:MAG: hypothetical protein KTU85_07105 [Acidimicrobiia bacterium]|nr:hypothetical protein [Acidimicrobiia bacterium]MCY4457623.1 hypothetical protein [Acidimicrobiaceae bacterium]